MKSISLLLFAFAVALATQANAVVLELRAQQTLIGGSVTLNDLLSSSQGLSTDDLAASVADAPSLGKTQTLTRDEIEKLLPPSLKQKPIEWAGAAACAISRPAMPCTEHDVRQLITAEIAKHLPADSDFSILETPNLDTFPIPQGELDVRVELGDQERPFPLGL